MRAVIYARISKDEQSKYSIGEQISLCQKFMEEEGHEVVEVFIDEGFSSKTMKRPALQKMLGQIKDKKFDIICVWNSDRLTRTTLDGLTMVTTMFKPADIDFASYTEDIDTSTPDGMMMFTIRLSMAQRERERIAERSSMGQAARARAGKRNTSARPYGYDVGEDLALTVNEEEAEIVRKIFDWYVGGWGRIKIAGVLNFEKIPANRGGKWPEKIIGDILKNITYTGAVHFKLKGDPESKRIIVPNVHEAIITKEQYNLAQFVFGRRRDNDMSQSSYDFVFSTVVKCALCGRSFHGKMKTFSDTRPHYRYYRCSGKYRPESMCTSSDLVEHKLIFSRIDTLLSPSYDDTKKVKTDRVDIEKERKRLEKQIAQSRERRKNYARSMGDGKMDYEEYGELVSEEKNKADKWQQELDDLPQEELTMGQTMKDIRIELERVKKNWSSMSNEIRKTSIQHLFKRIVIGKINNEWAVLGHEFN
jgi:site-specific DNA recombinase